MVSTSPVEAAVSVPLTPTPANDLDRKFFTALVNGLIRIVFVTPTPSSAAGAAGGDAEITRELLESQIFAQSKLDPESQHALIQHVEIVLAHAASGGWDASTLSSTVTELNWTAEHADALVQVWKKEQSRIHQSLVAQSTWSRTLSSIEWRIDVQHQSRQQQTIEQPIAVIKLHTHVRSSSPDDGAPASELLQLEIDAPMLQKVVTAVQEIDAIVQQLIK